MIQQLCSMFPALDPIRLRATPASEVIGLIRKVIATSAGIKCNPPQRKRVYADQVQWF